MYAEGGGEKMLPSSRSKGDVTVVHDCAVPLRQSLVCLGPARRLVHLLEQEVLTRSQIAADA